MTELVKYEAARAALAAAVAVDEVADIRNKADAMRKYARLAGDRGLEIQAAQIRFRAERRLGEMLIAAKNAGQLHAGRPGNDSNSEAFSDDGAITRVTLKEANIDGKLSMRAQQIAALEIAEFEQALLRHAEEMRAGKGRVAMDLRKIGRENVGRAHRRDLAQALSSQSAELPSGQRFPAMYLDPPWKREGGIGDRAYENHYPTMSWPEILAYLKRAGECLLPDAWAFMWVPRAHLLAPVTFERADVQVAATGELVTIVDQVPLAWACQLALGCDAYSTCFVWTKTDAEHPDVAGTGLIVRDQDELLLLFKKGRGLPKPEGAEKFGSNHRERPREHSRKPDFYRHMIATMVGRDSAGQPLPVLELFARVDAAHPLPENWQASGNQARLEGEAAEAIETEIAAGMPSDVGVATAADATEGASPAAVVDPFEGHFPPTEWADLQALLAQLDHDRLAVIGPIYARRGLAHCWLNKWRLTRAGEIRLDVLDRERAARNAMFANHLGEAELAEWHALIAIRGREHVDADAARNLIGKGYVDDVAADRGLLALTVSGEKWLRSIDAYVEKSEGITDTMPAPAPIAKQLNLV